MTIRYPQLLNIPLPFEHRARRSADHFQDFSPAEKIDHPIHIHGTGFQIVSLNGRKPEREIWKDTVNVPAGEYVDIAFTMTNPGTWMLHCHILDHEDGGMMTSIVAK